MTVRTVAKETAIGLIPEIEVIEEDHKLATDQKSGITYQQAVEIVNEIKRVQHIQIIK